MTDCISQLEALICHFAAACTAQNDTLERMLVRQASCGAGNRAPTCAVNIGKVPDGTLPTSKK
jgi:hypothetical protein